MIGGMDIDPQKSDPVTLFRVMGRPANDWWRTMKGGLSAHTADMLAETLREIFPDHEFTIERETR